MQKMTHRLTEELLRLSYENHDNCVACGYAFKEGDTSHLGYDKSGKPLYVCDKCSNQLHETAVRHYFSPRPYDIPTDNAKLWRYMDFTKYVSLLSTPGLYFARADTFSDAFEGAKGLRKNKQKWDEHYLSFFKMAIKNPPEGFNCDMPDEEIEKQAYKLLLDLEGAGESIKKHTFISCWHENEHESEAMWRLYSSFIDNAIAVRTTCKKLNLALGRNPSISIGRVRYIDFKKKYAGINDSFWMKRRSFEHEKEVRAIIIEHDTTELGKVVPCNLSVLIEEVFVSPSAPDWFVNLVNDLNNKYGLNIKVSSSELNAEPFF
jgi:hypothetical protein